MEKGDNEINLLPALLMDWWMLMEELIELRLSVLMLSVPY
jgi:hypothetical protein